LIEAWAGHKSFRKKGSDEGDPDAGLNFHGEKRTNQTHASQTDPESRLYKKSYGQEAKLSYLGHTLVENRNGLIVAAMATQADGMAERDAGILMLADLTEGGRRYVTVGADKAYDTQDFVATVRELQATPHVTQNNKNRRSAIDERTTRHPGYRVSLSKRWLVEKPFGWLKQIGGLRKVKLRGLAKVDWLFVFGCAAYNLLRIPKLREQGA
jgi:IS5 family transposase